MSSKIKIEINGEIFWVPKDETILQSCYRIGIEIPRFCYQENLSIAGNCRMCLVEVAYPKSLKPVASCMMQISEDMKIFTDTILVKNAREGVLEFLLANHPLDCPICDQGGECDLQDQALIFGSDRGRFYEVKRATEDKELGPLIKTSMTRCIHCTRCVRFCNEIAGIEILGVMGRGSNMEIGSFVEKVVNSEISGNVIDLCPVGALTSKPYAFTARPWELHSISTIDILDSFCSNIRVDIRGSEVMRVLPLMNSLHNEEWISDKTRFFHDGLKYQRLQNPSLKFENVFLNVSWEIAFDITKNFFFFFYEKKNSQTESFFRKNINETTISVFFGKLLDFETLIVLKEFFNKIGCNNFFFNGNKELRNVDFRSKFISEKKLDFNKIDCCILFNFNIRLEAPLLNIKLRKNFLKQELIVLFLGQNSGLNIPFFHIGFSVKSILEFFEGKNFFCRLLVSSNNPLFLINSSVFNFREGFLFQTFTNFFFKFIGITKEINFISFISSSVSEVSASELGILNEKSFNSNLNNNSFLYTIGSEKPNFFNQKTNNILIYQGHHGDPLAHYADIIFPSSAFLEKKATFLNYEGSVSETKFVIPSPGDAKDDWYILVSFFLFLEKWFLLINGSNNKRKIVGFFTQKEILDSYKNKAFLFGFFLSFFDYEISYKSFLSQKIYLTQCNFLNSLFSVKSINFYCSDSITRSSKILSLCVQRFLSEKNNFE